MSRTAPTPVEAACPRLPRYTHANDIPPQYGPGFSIDEARVAAGAIDGRDGASWSLPLSLTDERKVEPLAPLQAALGDESARHEAAFELIANHENVVRFAARGLERR